MFQYWRRLLLRLALVLSVSSGQAAEVQGFSEPNREIDIAAQGAGVLAQIMVKEGDSITNGQTLASLDCEVLCAALAVARVRRDAVGKLDALKAQRDVSKRKLDKIAELDASGTARPDEVDRARADLAIAEANLLEEKESQNANALQCKQIEAEINLRCMRSPIDGVVTKIHKEVAESVTAADSKVMTVVQLNLLKVTCFVPPREAAMLQRDQAADILFQDCNLKAEGKIDFISPVTDPESGTTRVKLLVDNSQGKLRSGARCMVAFRRLHE